MDQLKIAFLVLAHKDVKNVLRLVKRLSPEKEETGIFIHFDAKMALSDDERKAVEAYAHIVPDPISCQLDSDSLVRAAMKLLAYAKTVDDYDYYALISGQDYPIATVEEMVLALNEMKPRSLIDVIPYRKRNFVWFKFNVSPWYRKLNKKINDAKVPRQLVRIVKMPLLLLDIVAVQRTNTLKKQIGRKGFVPYGGCAWWVLHTSAVEDLFAFAENNKDSFERMMAKSFTPEETVIQTALMNSNSAGNITLTDLSVKPRNCATFIDFGEAKQRPMKPHPYVLTMDDLELLEKARKEGYFFARKFDPLTDTAVLDWIDQKWLDAEDMSTV